jgi:transcriptional regulator of acetoin/glycerol metabolism
MSEKIGGGSETTEPTGGPGQIEAQGGDLMVQWVLGGEYRERSVLRAARLRIGRGSTCHVRLDHPSVSREHAELYRQGPIYAVRDLGSTNGTHLNGSRTEHGVLRTGDVLRVGDYVGIVGMLPRAAETSRFGELAPGLFGGPTLAAALAVAKVSASTDIPFVIIGETGAGKERIARAIHHLSGRPGRFHALNCAALPATLAEAELFGHERGAFTGAERAREGHLRAADRGTLFLDEIADLGAAVQAKLLRALETHEVTPVGTTECVSFDARVIVATQEPLECYVERKAFRADLYARLAGFQLEAPPLRRRRDEIIGLFAHFLRIHGTGEPPAVEPKLAERLCLHDWPNNVRELELFTRKLLALKQDEKVLTCQLAARLWTDVAAPAAPAQTTGFRERRVHESARLQAALSTHGNNMTAAAASIGISRRRAYRLLAMFKDETSAGAGAGADADGEG